LIRPRRPDFASNVGTGSKMGQLEGMLNKDTAMRDARGVSTRSAAYTYPPPWSSPNNL
jgi:hypothetical protein